MEEVESKKPRILTDEERATIDKNRQLALQRIQSNATKLVNYPSKSSDLKAEESIIKVQGNKFIDSGGGFLIEKLVEDKESSYVKIITKDRVITLPVEFEKCKDCDQNFIESFLHNNFNLKVCDNCCDNEDKHSLITRTEAKQEYLLKDCDLDKREPKLSYITRKNPHNSYWGEMKLYLHLQIEERALEVWGTEENLMKQRESREDKREISKLKKYKKQLKGLRMNVRSSLYDKTKSASHTHTFGPDTHNAEEDNYTHTCTECNFVETYEKM